MSRLTVMDSVARIRKRPGELWAGLKEISVFFEGKGEVHKSLRRLAKKLEKASIPYAVVGGMAVFAHRHRRTTDDVDILLSSEGFQEFCRRFVPKNYRRSARRSQRFLDLVNQVTVDFLLTGNFPGTGEPGPISYPDPAKVGKIIDNVRVVDLPTLIQLKLAARRHYDFGDVANLIRVHKLDESFLPRLHPTLHRDFIECLEEKRRDDLYHERQKAPSKKATSPKRYGPDDG